MIFNGVCPTCRQPLSISTSVPGKVSVNIGEETNYTDGFVILLKHDQRCERCKAQAIALISSGKFLGFVQGIRCVDDRGAVWMGETFVPLAVFNHLVAKSVAASAAIKPIEGDIQ